MKFKKFGELETEELIQKINSSKSYVEVFESISEFRGLYKPLMKELHPDICEITGAANAASVINIWRDSIETGNVFNDDAGKVTYFPDRCVITGDPLVLSHSLMNYNFLMGLIGPEAELLKRYLPLSMKLISNELHVFYSERNLPLNTLSKIIPVPDIHVTWILSRLLEFSGYLSNFKIAHCGLTPDSVFINPETHGVTIISFYHLLKIGDKVTTVSAGYRGNYPPHLTAKDNKATQDIDLYMSKYLCVTLLGDASGRGTKLRTTQKAGFVNFLLEVQQEPRSAFLAFREMLKKHFDTKVFHILKI